MTTALAVATGVVALVAGLARLGFLANFISEPVLKGFIVGLALTIIIGQLPSLFGVAKGGGDFFAKLWDVVTNLGDTNGATLAVGALSLAVVLGLRRVAPAVPALARRGRRSASLAVEAFVARRPRRRDRRDDQERPAGARPPRRLEHGGLRRPRRPAPSA